MFTYNIQLAGYDFKQVDQKGPITAEQFREVLYNFPWKEQLTKYSEINEGASATVSVVNADDETTLWVSVAGEADQLFYLTGYIYNKSVKGLLGLGKAKTKRWVDIYKVRSLDTVMEFFTLYFAGKKEELESQLFLEKKFDSMEAMQ